MADFNLNQNMLDSTRFSFTIKKTPGLNEFIQSVDVPGLSLPAVDVGTPFKVLPRHGDHPVLDGDLTVTFKINEDLSNYIQLWNWLIETGAPDSFDQHKEIAERQNTTGEGIYSDATLIIMSGTQNPIVKIEFHDLFPTSIGPIPFDVKTTNVDYITTNVGFKYKFHYFETY